MEKNSSVYMSLLYTIEKGSGSEHLIVQESNFKRQNVFALASIQLYLLFRQSDFHQFSTKSTVKMLDRFNDRWFWTAQL